MRIFPNFQLSDLLWYKIGGKARFLIEIENISDVFAAHAFLREKEISRFFVVGLGANLVFTDDFFDGVILHLKGNKKSFHFSGNTVEAFAGENLSDLITFSFGLGLRGLEWAGGLPGTVGAGVRGNVGAFGSEIKSVFESASVFDLTAQKQEFFTLDKKAMDFVYRGSLIKKNPNFLIVSARFNLQHVEKEELAKAKEVYFDCINYRLKNHPHTYPNTGSVFKNITEKEEVEKVLAVFPDLKDLVKNKWHGKVSMGYLNKRLGFAGFTIGGARVSEMHSNFIDNIDMAKAQDVVAIIEAIQSRFQEVFGFKPEPEVEIVENSFREHLSAV